MMNTPTQSTTTINPLEEPQQSDLISISEIFGPTIQGEGALIGTQTIFVRTGGCDYRCGWCDTGYAVLAKFKDDWRAMDAKSVLAEIHTLTNQQAIWVTLSGGNPAMQNLEPLIKLGQEKGYHFSMETQGSIAKPWFSLLNQLTLSPKPPSSGMSFKKRGLDRCLKACDGNKNMDICLKFVIADIQDLIWAKNIADQYSNIPCFVQPCNIHASIEDQREPINASQDTTHHQQMLWLIEALQSLNWHNARVLPQLHTWLWGNQAGV